MSTKHSNIGKDSICFALQTLFICFSCCCLNVAYTQVKFNLEDCIAYGLLHSPELLRQDLDIERAKIEKKQMQFEQLPAVNLGGTHGFNWGQSIDPFTNQFASGRVRTNNFYIGSSWELFRGLEIRYQIKRSDLAIVSAKLDSEIARRNQKLKIISAYIQLQQAFWEVALRKEMLSTSTVLKTFVEKKYDSGRATYIEHSQANAIFAKDSAALIKAEGEYNFLKVNLSQLINIAEDSINYAHEEIDNVISKISPTVDYDIHEIPEIKQTEIEQAAKALDYKASKAKLLPRLYLNTALGSGYSGNNTELTGTQLTPKPFLVQMDENFYQTAVLSLNIPVFNHYRVRSEIKIMALELEQTQLLRDQYILDFNRTVEELKMRLKNEVANIYALELALAAADNTLTGAEKSYYHGVTNLQDYVQIRAEKAQQQFAFNQSVLSAYTFSLFLKTYFN